METINKRKIIVLIFLLLFFVSGCVPLKGSGKIWADHKVTIHDLERKWDDFAVSYAGLSEENAAALMFDIKDDNKRLLGKTWNEVKDKKTLSSIIGWIKAYPRYDPSVWRILGPNDQLFGYIFTLRNNVLMKVIDDNTLYVYDVPSPLYDDDGYDFDNVPEPRGGP